MVGDTKSRLLAKVFENNCPLAITSYSDDNNNEDNNNEENFYQYWEEERLSMLLSALSKTVMKSVAKAVAKVMEVSKVILPQEASWKMLQEMVILGEQEPYGVRGGTLVVLLMDRLGKVHKICRFPLDPDTISTYEIQLTLHEDKHFKSKFAAFIRRLSGKLPQLDIDQHYELRKKKLYRSSSSSCDSV